MREFFPSNMFWFYLRLRRLSSMKATPMAMISVSSSNPGVPLGGNTVIVTASASWNPENVAVIVYALPALSVTPDGAVIVTVPPAPVL